MSWATELYKTYEANYSGQLDDGSPMPVFHFVKSVDFEILLDQSGNFKGASVIDGQDTLIPVTMRSAGARTNNPPPHALVDQLGFVAGDFKTYAVGEKTNRDGVPNSAQRFNSYISGLEDWHNYSSHPKVRAIYGYLQKKECIADLVKSKCLELDATTSKFSKTKQDKYFKMMVRFKVLNPQMMDFEGTWEDSSLVWDYIQYYRNKLESDSEVKKGICQISGQEDFITKYHPTLFGKLKLISFNQIQNYVGNYHDANQALSMGLESSHKIHNTLDWLLETQGIHIEPKQGKKEKGAHVLHYLCWSPSGKILPELNITSPMELSKVRATSSGIEYRLMMQDYFDGRRREFTNLDNVNIMALMTGHSEGRCAIVYYESLCAKDFFDRLEKWCCSCQWYFFYRCVYTPTFYQIVTRALGEEMEVNLKKDGRGVEKQRKIVLDSKVLSHQIRTLIDCMIGNKPIQTEIVRGLYEKASSPHSYKDGNNYEKVLSTACAVIYREKLYYHQETEEEGMALNPNNHDRSYLYGRMLAVYDAIEQKARYVRKKAENKAEDTTEDMAKDRGKDKESRETNAALLHEAFVREPLKYSAVLDEAVEPYLRRLSPGSRIYYRNLLSEIASGFDDADVENKRLMGQKLEPYYLLGFYLQRHELKNKSDMSRDVVDLENEEE